MARGVNKVILIGNLGKDPELKTFPSGGAVANATLATSESWRDKDGNQQERTEWHNVVFHNKLAEIAAQYLRKGGKAYIEGSLRTRKWTDKDGRDRYTTEIHASEMQMLDGRPGGDASFGGVGAGTGSSSGHASAGARGGTRGGDANRGGDDWGRTAAGGAAAAPMANDTFEDDDIPF